MSQSNAYSDLRVFGEIKSGKLTIFGEYSLPTADGAANQILVTDGSGNVSFQDASAVALTPPSIIDGTGINWTTIAPNTIQGNVTLAPFTTTNLAEGVNLYYTDERVDDRVNALLINGTGITKAYDDSLNTLTLGVTLAPFTTTNLAEGVNLYYTDERVEDRMAAVLYKGGRGTGPDAITWTHVDGLDRIFPTVSLTPFSTDDLAEGTTNLYLTENSLYDLMDQIIQDSASVTWTRNTVTNELTATATGSSLEVQLDGSVIALNPTIDFITTPTISYVINDDIVNGKTTIQIDSPSDAVIVLGTGAGSAVRKDNLNSAIGDYSTISGGDGNTVSGDYSTIAGGTCNSITSPGSFVGGGANHNVSGEGLPIMISPISTGPFPNAVDGNYFPTNTTSGLGFGTGIEVIIATNTLTGWGSYTLGVNYQVGDTITIDGADVGGVSGVDDIVFTVDAVIDGGSAVAGGFNNDIFGVLNYIGSGGDNLICGHAATVAGGNSNCINGLAGFSDFSLGSVIGGGIENVVCGDAQVISGGIGNVISSSNGSTIGGGDANSITIPYGINQAGFSTIAGGHLNTVLAQFGTIGGGLCNTASGSISTVGGGRENTALSNYSTIGGGESNTASGYHSTVGGGVNNAASDYYSTVSGGVNNAASSNSSTVGGGRQNTASSYSSTVSGGYNNTASGSYSGILGGRQNTASGYRSTISGGEDNIASGACSTVGGGTFNTTSGDASTVGGGGTNTTSGCFSVVSGGGCNQSSCDYSTVGGGRGNTASNTYSTVSGGYNNAATGISSTVGGGSENTALGVASTLSGGLYNATLSYSSTVSGGSCNITDADYSTIGGGFCNSACGIATTIGGGYNNVATECNSTISGGYSNTVSCCFSTIGGGSCNDVSNIGATIGGGACNTASGQAATVGGGVCNLSSCNVSTVSGGFCNTASSYTTTVGGGNQNVASNNSSIVGGGFQNTASGYRSTISGGEDNIASCNYSTVGGGTFNTTSGDASTVGGGNQNTASNSCSTVGGGFCNTASGARSTIGGGCRNTASGACSTIMGGYCNTVTHGGASAVGCNITSVCPNTLHTNYLNLYNFPAADQCNTTFLVRESNGMVNYRTYGGLFAQTAQSSTITATVTESSLITTGVGSLIVPSNGFAVGDSFTARLAGTLSAANGQTLHVRVKSGSVLLADTGTMTLPTITTKYWQLEIGFTIRAIGAATVAIISSNGLFSYTQNSGNSHEAIGFNTINSTTFDTTGSNTLSVTAEWGSTNAANSIFSSSFTLHKTF
jgi:hypothetical protein